MILDLSGRTLHTLNDNHFVLEELAKRHLSFDDVTEMKVSGCQLEDLFGIDMFRNLESLDASHNNISLLDPLVSLNLSKLKLDHNRVEYLFIKELSNGLVVLSSDPDNDYTESFLEFGLNYSRSEMTSHTVKRGTVGYKLVDLSFNKLKFVKNMTTRQQLEVGVMLLSNNQVSDFEGLQALTGVKKLDLSFNEECDLEQVHKAEFMDQSTLILQSTRLTNLEYLTNLLNKYQRMVIHHETDSVQHERLINPYDIHINKVKHKKFVRTEEEFADFVYEGDSSPSELLTPRYLNTENLYPEGESKEKTTKSLSQVETQSSYDENYLKQGSVQSERELNEGRDRDQYQVISGQERKPYAGKGRSKFVKDLNEIDFLISSMELCKKIDMWSDNIKNTLYKDIRY